MVINDVVELDRRIKRLVLVEVLEDGLAPDEYNFRRNPIVVSPDELRGDYSVKRVHVVFEQCAGKTLKEIIALSGCRMHRR
jgi:hypothetical protein